LRVNGHSQSSELLDFVGIVWGGFQCDNESQPAAMGWVVARVADWVGTWTDVIVININIFKRKSHNGVFRVFPNQSEQFLSSRWRDDDHILEP
jgi:hypothetical protein